MSALCHISFLSFVANGTGQKEGLNRMTFSELLTFLFYYFSCWTYLFPINLIYVHKCKPLQYFVNGSSLSGSMRRGQLWTQEPCQQL
jgi:hypothetical protein